MPSQHSRKAAFSSHDEFQHTLAMLKEKFAKMQPELEVTVRDSEAGVEGFVVVWNTDICKGGPFDRNGHGAGKGGTRILPGLKLEDIKRLARAMAEKNAAAGLPLGGAKSGLNADPNAPDYEKKFRRFARLVKDAGLFFEDGGIFGGFGYDVGGRPPYNAIWACDELKTHKCFTGKPVDMGGTDYDREGIAGLGVAVAARTLLEIRKKNVKGARFAVQGVGAMGAAVIRYFSEYGGALACLSDPKYGGTWAFKNGASPALLTALVKQEAETAKKLLTAEGQKLSDNSFDALYQDVDVVFPCAMEDVVTAENAGKIRAPFMIEGANNPTRDEAHKILYKNGTIVVPDIIANPGGIIAAFVELTSQSDVKVNEAKELTIKKVTANVHELLAIVDSCNAQPDQAGDYIAYRNIFEGIPSP